MSTERLLWIDRMRGIAILSVVIQHLAYNFENEFVYRDLIGISNMGLFFFVSGYIMQHTAYVENIHDMMEFIKKKALQLLLPLLMWGLVLPHIAFQSSWSAITVSELLHEWHDPHLWFLLTLFGYCILFAVYQFVCQICKGGGKIAFWLASWMILFVIWRITHEFKLATLYIPYFAAGCITRQFSVEHVFRHRAYSLLSILSILILLPFFNSGAISVSNIVVKMVCTLAVIQLTYRICTEWTWNKKVDHLINEFGKGSIAIYCVHWTFLTVFTDPKPLLPNNELLGFTIVTIFAVLVAYTCIIVKRIVSLSSVLYLLMFGQKIKI